LTSRYRGSPEQPAAAANESKRRFAAEHIHHVFRFVRLAPRVRELGVHLVAAERFATLDEDAGDHRFEGLGGHGENELGLNELVHRVTALEQLGGLHGSLVKRRACTLTDPPRPGTNLIAVEEQRTEHCP
jgi:hypothetical protein